MQTELKVAQGIANAFSSRMVDIRRHTQTIAIACIVIGIAMPAMEIVPFSANGAGAALTAFGLSLIANDGLLALLAFLFTAATFILAAFGVM